MNTTKFSRLSRNQALALWAIMLTAAFLRARLLLQIEHNIDHAYPVWQALMTLDRGIFPLVGQQTSVLIANPPLTGYLFLPLVALTRLAIAPYLLVIPLNTLGVLLSFRSMRALIGVNGALIGAALMAVNPWMIEYSRTSWVQSLLPFLVPGLFWALIPVVLGTAKHPAKRLILACVILTVTVNTYLLAYALVIPVGILVVVYRKQVKWRALAVGMVIFGCAAGLYGVGLLSQKDEIIGRVESFASVPPHLSDEALNHAIRLVTGADYELVRGLEAPIDDVNIRRIFGSTSHLILTCALVCGVALAVYRVIRWRDARSTILLIWFLTPILLMSYVGQVIHPFYQLLGVPAGYGLVGLAIGALTTKRKEKDFEPQRSQRTQRDIVARPYVKTYPTPSPNSGSRALIAGVVVVFLGVHGVVMGINSSRYYEETAAIPGAHGLTALPLDWGMRLGDSIRENLPHDSMVMSELDQPYILSSFAGMALDYLHDLPSYTAYIRPASGGLYIAQDGLGFNLDYDPPVFQIDLPDSRRFGGFVLRPAIEYLGDETRIASDQGITFAGAQISDAHLVVSTGLTLDFLITDRVEGIDGRTFGAFAHVFDSTGARVAVVSGDVIPGYLWHVGDVHRYMLLLSRELEGTPPYHIGIGMYDPNANINAIFVTPEGEYTPILMLPEEWTP